MRDCVRRFAEAMDKAIDGNHRTMTDSDLVDHIDDEVVHGLSSMDDKVFAASLVRTANFCMAAWDNQMLGRAN